MAANNKKLNWGYANNNGPHAWSRRFGHATGAYQSPVNVDTASVVFSAKLNNPPLHMAYHNPLKSCCLSNTGISFQVAADSDVAYISGGPLSGRYQFEQLHMHWGARSGWGSEHWLDGRAFSAELHLVHWNASKFASFQEAMAIKGGLAVLGAFVQVGSEHPHLQQIVGQFEKIRKPGSAVVMETPVSLSDLLPTRTHDFFTYEGSLTTPPCFESVNWILFRQPIEMSEEQLQQLRSLHFESGAMLDNYRPPVPLGNRKILASCHPFDLEEAG